MSAVKGANRPGPTASIRESPEPGSARRDPQRSRRRERLSDIAFEEIRRRIIRLEYRPGAYLNVAQVRAQLGLGATPVNQALNRLMIEGMVEVVPRQGTIVRPISFEEILNIIDVRVVTETQGARLAAERATDSEIAALFDQLDHGNVLLGRRDIEGLMQLDREFHMLLSNSTRNPVLADILRSLHERSLRFWFVSLSDAEPLRQMLVEHRQIAERLRARDIDGASAAMRAHIESFRAMVVRSPTR
jgi:DNA-binding GntR family transcriptional regulator